MGEEEFRAVCAGRHPATGAQLLSPGHDRDKKTGEQVEQVEQVEMHWAGNECTNSPPKSLSAAYAAGVPGIGEAHDAAVTAVLRHQEEHYTLYRAPAGVQRGELVAAVFTHATSRSLDPQLHSHVFVINMVRLPDGSWKANWNRPIFQKQKSLGLIYRQELARELQERGCADSFLCKTVCWRLDQVLSVGYRVECETAQSGGFGSFRFRWLATLGSFGVKLLVRYRVGRSWWRQNKTIYIVPKRLVTEINLLFCM